MNIGYMRTSKIIQNLDLQSDALNKVGCDKIFSDQVSGAKFDRPGLNEMLEFARNGDTITVWRLDRLGRSLRHLIDLVEQLNERGVGLRSITEGIDTTTTSGRLFFNIICCLGQFEREVLRERCMAGLQASRKRGVIGGRKAVLTGKKLDLAITLRSDRNMPVNEAIKILGCSRTTFYRSTAKPSVD